MIVKKKTNKKNIYQLISDPVWKNNRGHSNSRAGLAKQCHIKLSLIFLFGSCLYIGHSDLKEKTLTRQKETFQKRTVVVGEGPFLNRRLKISTERILLLAAVSAGCDVSVQRLSGGGTCGGCVLSLPVSCLRGYPAHSSKMAWSRFKPFLFLTFCAVLTPYKSVLARSSFLRNTEMWNLSPQLPIPVYISAFLQSLITGSGQNPLLLLPPLWRSLSGQRPPWWFCASLQELLLCAGAYIVRTSVLSKPFLSVEPEEGRESRSSVLALWSAFVEAQEQQRVPIIW